MTRGKSKGRTSRWRVDLETWGMATGESRMATDTTVPTHGGVCASTGMEEPPHTLAFSLSLSPSPSTLARRAWYCGEGAVDGDVTSHLQRTSPWARAAAQHGTWVATNGWHGANCLIVIPTAASRLSPTQPIHPRRFQIPFHARSSLSPIALPFENRAGRHPLQIQRDLMPTVDPKVPSATFEKKLT